MTTLVTGATGFIGRRLMQPDWRALVRHPSGFNNEVIGDLLDPRSLEKACSGVDVVFHCAGYAHALHSSNAEIHNDVNYFGVKNLVEAAGRANVRSFVFLSSVKAMSDSGDECVCEDWPMEPETPYGQAKRSAEIAVLDAGSRFGMHVVNLRLAMVYGHGGRGNLERMARAIRSGWFPPLPETGNKRSLVHVQDVVDVIKLVANQPNTNGRAYIVANSEAYSGRQIYDAIRDALCFSRAPNFSVPAELLRALARVNGRIGLIVDRLTCSACYSPARIEREIGWRARVGLVEGVREMLSMSVAEL